MFANTALITWNFTAPSSVVAILVPIFSVVAGLRLLAMLASLRKSV